MEYYSVSLDKNAICVKPISVPELDTYDYYFIIVKTYSYYEVIPTTLAIKELNDSLIIDIIHYIKVRYLF